MNREKIQHALDIARQRLLAERDASGHWIGELSTSALSTATSVFALSLVRKSSTAAPLSLENLISGGLNWLRENQNPDGGWGDTIKSKSNLSTTLLVWSALAVPEAHRKYDDPIARAEEWIRSRVGSLDPVALAKAVADSYGKDRTFSVPILTMATLAGRLGTNLGAPTSSSAPAREVMRAPGNWELVPSLPFEFAMFPRSFYKFLRLQVVSYALPALIAIGQTIHHHRPSRFPPLKWMRNLAKEPTLNLLIKLQPSTGGFLEAAPLTGFVLMSLAAMGKADHPVARRATEFLIGNIRPDGSWPIDTNLASWTTTLAVNAIAEGSGIEKVLGEKESDGLRDWILDRQFREVHPFTQAAPGGWAWTDLPGGVPDADDTPGAILALRKFYRGEPALREAAKRGIEWLMDLQNRDGGIPTFCRGWGALPFDRSGCDLTAHAMRAFIAWKSEMPAAFQSRIDRTLRGMTAYLQKEQRIDGSWLPLWFGNQDAPGNINPVYGTSRVLAALLELNAHGGEMSDRAAGFLIAAQNDDGGWGGPKGTPSSTEETSLALGTLASYANAHPNPPPEIHAVIERGAGWLVQSVESGKWVEPSPIGFYFANLWYYERLYPIIFAVEALGKLAAHE